MSSHTADVALAGLQRGQAREDDAPPGDAMLVTAAKCGDEAAFDILYRRYFAMIVNYLVARGATPEDANDAAQDAFMLAFRRLHQLEQGERFHSWVRRVAIYKWYDLARGRARREEPLPLSALDTLLSESTSEIPQEDDPEKAVLAKEMLERLRQAVNMLNGRQRDIIRLMLTGSAASYSEICSALGIGIGSIGPTYSRALLTLKRMLTDDGEQRDLRTVSRHPEPPATAPTPGQRKTVLLPPRQREVLDLSEQGLTPKQIAARLSISNGDARANLCLARKRVAATQPGR